MSAAVAFCSDELAYSIIEGHFDAVRDTFVEYRPDGGHQDLRRLKRTRFVIDPAIHNSDRHFAATRDDGLLMMFAPGLAHLQVETLTAIVAHEFGHAADHLYPGAFAWPRAAAGPTAWVGESSALKALAWRSVFGKPDRRSRIEQDDAEPAANWMTAWERRTRDQVEWAADAIAQMVTGISIGYCGPCVLQCFSGGQPRPKGLR